MAHFYLNFKMARLLTEAWPNDARREALIGGAFRLRHPDRSHRARLRAVSRR